MCHYENPTGHWCVAQTATLVTRRFLVPGIKAKVQQYVRTCPICQEYKTEHHLPRGYLDNLDIQNNAGSSFPWTG